MQIPAPEDIPTLPLRSQRWPLKLFLLAIWAAASFGACYFARDLQFMVADWPFGFWMAAQGSVLVFLLIVVVHAWVMNRAERKAGAGRDV